MPLNGSNKTMGFCIVNSADALMMRGRRTWFSLGLANNGTLHPNYDCQLSFEGFVFGDPPGSD